MALTEQERQEWFDVIERTGQFRVEAIKEREIPDWYRAFAEEVTREERTFEFEGLRPVRVVITKAKELGDHASLHINMHGGGFWFKQNEDDDLYCAHIAAKTHGVVLDIDYAVVSEAPFPMAFEQSYRVVSWAVEHCVELGADPTRISIGGMSAGGNLAAAIALRAAGTKDFELCLLVLDNAAIDLAMAVKTQENERTVAFSELYANGDHRLLETPYCSPSYADESMFAGMPRILVVNAEKCPFKNVNEQFALRVAAQGSEVTIKCFMNSAHGFAIRIAGEWAEAQDLIIRTIDEAGL